VILPLSGSMPPEAIPRCLSGSDAEFWLGILIGAAVVAIVLFVVHIFFGADHGPTS
jgi:hypothetical protein